MNGNEPVKSLYTTLLFLPTKAPKQKTFAMDSFSSILIGWDSVMGHTLAPDMVGAAERVAKHVAREQGRWG
jgi:hypothetical protein